MQNRTQLHLWFRLSSSPYSYLAYYRVSGPQATKAIVEEDRLEKDQLGSTGRNSSSSAS